MPVAGVLKYFIKSFPTATILYILLVLMTNLEFSWIWLGIAFVIDIVDDVISQGFV